LVVFFLFGVSEPDSGGLEGFCTHQRSACHQREEQEHGKVIGAKICVWKVDEWRDADGKYAECTNDSRDNSDEPCHICLM
jgi:hypothetical protein